MNLGTRIFEVNAFQFEANDTDVLVKGTMIQNHMSFQTDVLISQSGLNRLINELYKQNEGSSVHDLITTDWVDENEMLYSAELTSLPNRNINLNNLFENQTIKRIRA